MTKVKTIRSQNANEKSRSTGLSGSLPFHCYLFRRLSCRTLVCCSIKDESPCPSQELSAVFRCLLCCVFPRSPQPRTSSLVTRMPERSHFPISKFLRHGLSKMEGFAGRVWATILLE